MSGSEINSRVRNHFEKEASDPANHLHVWYPYPALMVASSSHPLGQFTLLIELMGNGLWLNLSTGHREVCTKKAVKNTLPGATAAILVLMKAVREPPPK